MLDPRYEADATTEIASPYACVLADNVSRADHLKMLDPRYEADATAEIDSQYACVQS